MNLSKTLRMCVLFSTILFYVFQQSVLMLFFGDPYLFYVDLFVTSCVVTKKGETLAIVLSRNKII
jgi:hypothetical protein